MVSAQDFLQGSSPTLVEQPEALPTKNFAAGQNVSASDFLQGQSPVVSEPTNPEEKLNFLERFGQDLADKNKVKDEIVSAVQNGEQSFAEGALQVFGKVGAAGTLDLIGETIISGGRGLSAITPDFIEEPLKEGAGKAATAAAHFFLDTSIGQKGLEAAKGGIEDWFEFKGENPRAARNIEAVVDIGLLLAPVKGKPKVKSPPTAIGKAGAALEAKAEAQITKTKAGFVDDLIRPKQTAAVRKEQVARTTEGGALGTKKVALTPREAEIAKAVGDVDVSKSNTLQTNYNIISKEAREEAGRLEKALEKTKIAIPKREVSTALDDAVVRLKENPLIVGDAEKTAEKILVKMRQIVGKNEGTAAGLLKSRKELDSWMRSQKGANVFDPKNESALTIALREIRQTTNDFIEMSTPNVAVKQSLRKQSNLLSAMENIAPKAADEGGNAAVRAWQNVSRLLPLRGEFNQTMALMFGVGGLGAAATFAPFFTKLAFGGLGTYAAGKVLFSPQTKKGLAMLLKQVDKAILKTKDEALIQQMRADRALILELLKEDDK